MNTFHLQIVTPDGLMFDNNAEKVVVRTVAGDVGILANHTDYVSPLSSGTAKVALEGGETRTAECSGGLISVRRGIVRIAADTFEWTEKTHD